MTDDRNIVWHHGKIDRTRRHQLIGQRGATVWLTGLSGSGKSTIAVALEQVLLEHQINAYRLDGDNIRHGLNSDLGFSAEDRSENIRRIGEVAKLFADAGVICLSSFISPYRSDRQLVRQLHDQAELPFIEVHVDVPLDVAEQRDPKGLYAKARAGEIRQFTGIDAPYEPPQDPALVLPTDRLTVDQCVSDLLDYLTSRGLFDYQSNTMD